MGQQQLLLIVLGVIIVGIAIVIGIQLLEAHSIEQKRELLIAECVNLAAMAQKYYYTPKAYGGGGGNFTGWEIHKLLKSSINGEFEFTAEPSAQDITINAKGNENVAMEELVEVNILIRPNDYDIDIVH